MTGTFTLHTSLKPSEIAGYSAHILLLNLMRKLGESGPDGEALVRAALHTALEDLEKPDADGTVPTDNVVIETFIRGNFPTLLFSRP